MKICSACKQIGEFYKKKSTKDVLQSICKECKKQYRKDNVEEIRQYDKEYRQANPERKTNAQRKYYLNNIEEIKQYNKQRYQDNIEEIRQDMKQYRQDNQGKVNARHAKRRAAKIQRTPKWLTSLDWEKIEEFYIYARFMTETLGIPHVVDHIIPLQGKNISGLHVPENLRIITARENGIKYNNW